MSKLFFDKLTSLKKLDHVIKEVSESKEEQEELWHLVDELITQRVLKVILRELEESDHEEFVNKLHESPHDESLLDYLKDKIKKDAKDFLKEEIILIGQELLEEFKKKPRNKNK